MKKVNLLSKADMRNVMGGYVQEGKCGKSECTTNDDCSTENPKIKTYDCIEDGTKVNYCVQANS